MKIRHPVAIRWAAAGIAGLLKLWTSTLRLREVYLDELRHPICPTYRRMLYACWHESFFCLAKKRANVRFLISRHADGELVAQVSRYFRAGAVRGSTTRGGFEALLELAAVDEGHLLITPDGPRGPRRRVQPGIIRLASATGLPIVFGAFGFQRAWRAPSWDRFAIPMPGSTVFCVGSEAIAVPPNLNRTGIDWWRESLERRFLSLTEQAELWAAGGPPPRRLDARAACS